MADQTRFTTEQKAYEVLRDLLRPLELRGDEGDLFVVDLVVPIRRNDTVEPGTLSIYVERLDLTKDEPISTYEFENEDTLLKTRARLSKKEGKPYFGINVFIPYMEAKYEGAVITVSPEMERRILKRYHKEIERELS